MLALTFDDGPDPRGTSAVLDALAAVDARATFFVLGARVEQHPDLLRRTVDAGHDVGVHGFEHLRHPDTPQSEVATDLDRALETLTRHGIEPAYWRIPWGHLADYTVQLARERDLTIVGWSADTHDWRGLPARTMLNDLPLEYGGIVLAHDGMSVGARRTTAKQTADLVGPLVAKARAQGLTPTALTPDWPTPLPVGNPNFHPGVVLGA